MTVIKEERTDHSSRKIIEGADDMRIPCRELMGIIIIRMEVTNDTFLMTRMEPQLLIQNHSI